MKAFECLDDWRTCRADLQGSLGLVPTMGALHAGHEALVRASVAQNDQTVVSIFVNPTQFDRPDDLQAYPRDLQRDLDLLQACGVDWVILPDYAQLYPDGYRFRLSVSELSKRYCGAHRPGHFDGVLTVVMKLLNLAQPDRAYFGEKDYQQLALIRGMVEAFFLPVEIVPCPIVREADGLALSSRNRRLDEEQRARAPELHRALVESDGVAAAAERLARAGFEVDYVEEFDGRRLAAASLGNIRLIDNVPLEH